MNWPIEHGVIKDWVDMEALWDYTYDEIKAPKETHPAFLTEAALNPVSNREKMAEIFFEKYNTPALFICSQVLLPLYANAKTTGVVLDCGDGICQCAPIYEGFLLKNTAQRIDIGGRDITEYMCLLLQKAGCIFYTSVIN